MAWFFLSSFPVPPFCLFSGPGESLPQKHLIHNSKFLILNQRTFSPVGKIFPPYWESDFLCAFQSHDKGTTSVGGSHTLPDKFTCYLAVRASLRFALLRGLLLNVLAVVGQMDIPGVLTFGPFLHRLSATRLPIMPHISFPFQSGNVNSAPFTCNLRIWNSIGTIGWRMSFLFKERYCEIPNYLCVL